MPTYKLTYFDIHGRGELSRLLFAAAGKSFEDNRVAFADWPKLKPTTPNGSLPILEIDGKPHTQSFAIAKYLAREFKLAGKSSLEEFRVDEILMVTEEFFQIIGKILFEKDEARQKELNDNLINQDVPRFAKFFEKILTEHGTSYFAGKALTAADIAVFQIFDSIISKHGEEMFKDTPKLLANRKKVEADAKISNYLKKRK